MEDAELELASSLKTLGVTIIIIITKASNFTGSIFEEQVRKQFVGITPHVVLARAIEEDLIDDQGCKVGVRKVKGVDELLSLSYTLLPESQRQSFANALSAKNRKAVGLKRDEAKTVVNVAAAAAGAAGATPLLSLTRSR